MKIIKLTKGFETMVDDEDFEILSRNKWKAHPSRANMYARRNIRINGKCKSLIMHRIILNAPQEMQVDHVDGNTLNNQKCNLRLCTRKENQHSFRTRPLRYSSKFRGVIKSKDCSSWLARITFNWKGIHIGSFKTEEEAALARDRKAIELYGSFAQLNFPNENV